MIALLMACVERDEATNQARGAPTVGSWNPQTDAAVTLTVGELYAGAPFAYATTGDVVFAGPWRPRADAGDDAVLDVETAVSLDPTVGWATLADAAGTWIAFQASGPAGKSPTVVRRVRGTVEPAIANPWSGEAQGGYLTNVRVHDLAGPMASSFPLPAGWSGIWAVHDSENPTTTMSLWLDGVAAGQSTPGYGVALTTAVDAQLLLVTGDAEGERVGVDLGVGAWELEVLIDAAGPAPQTYVDADGDGFGVGIASPGVGVGRSVVPGDCDDADGGRHPDQLDACGDGVDLDCDGLDACDIGSRPSTYLAGAAMASWTLDACPEVPVTIGLDAVSGIDGGSLLVDVGNQVHRLPGTPRGPLDLGQAAATVTGAGEAMRVAPGGPPDLDGDGVQEWLAFDNQVNNGNTWVLPADVVGDLPVGEAALGGYADLDADVDYAVAATDLTGDGLDDVVLGTGLDGNVANTFVVPGVPEGSPRPKDVAAFVLEHARGVAGLDGRHDLDGDGLVDLIVSEEEIETSGISVYLSPLVSHGNAAWTLGANNGGLRGVGTADVTGDGKSDFFVVAGLGDEVPAFRLARIEEPAASPADLTDGVVSASSRPLVSAAPVGDIDGDGLGDVLFGSPEADLVLLAPGPWSGTTLSDALDGWLGEAAGTALFPLGDVDGDGFADAGATDCGTLWLLGGAAP